MRKNKQRELVLVEWSDAWVLGRWAHENDERTEGLTVHSVGWLIDSSRHGIRISAQIQDMSLSAQMFIPRGMIRKVTRIRQGDIER